MVLEGCSLAPEYPVYFDVPTSELAAIEALAADGQIEFEARVDRAANGNFTVATQLQPVVPSRKPARRV